MKTLIKLKSTLGVTEIDYLSNNTLGNRIIKYNLILYIFNSKYLGH